MYDQAHALEDMNLSPASITLVTGFLFIAEANLKLLSCFKTLTLQHSFIISRLTLLPFLFLLWLGSLFCIFPVTLHS